MSGDLSGAVRTVTTGIDALKKLTDLAVKSQNIELQEGILGLRSQLLEIKESLLEAKEQNFDLREENKELKQKILELETQTEEKTIVKEGVYYAESGDGPFCTGCFDSNKKKIRVSTLSDGFEALGKYQCPTCKAVYSGK
jgi:regulator of replication initiation timing